MAIRNVSKSRKKNRFYLGQYAYKLATTKCIVHSEKTLRHFQYITASKISYCNFLVVLYVHISKNIHPSAYS